MKIGKLLTRCVFSLFVFLMSFLDAGLEQFFKKTECKSGVHCMRNIDFIYMINLDQRPEKFKLASGDLQTYNIMPYRFSAVNGWELSIETINAVGLKYSSDMQGGFNATSYFPEDRGAPRHGKIDTVGQTYFCHCMSQGAIGIVLSHLSILQDAWDSGYETIWVMEDDIEVVCDPHILSDRIEQLDDLVGKENFDVLFTDKDTKDFYGNYVPCFSAATRPDLIYTVEDQKRFAMKTKLGSSFIKIGARYGAYSMIIRRSGIKKILDFIKAHKIFFPYDMDFYLPPGINIYTVVDDVVSHRPGSPSDNARPGY